MGPEEPEHLRKLWDAEEAALDRVPSDHELLERRVKELEGRVIRMEYDIRDRVSREVTGSLLSLAFLALLLVGSFYFFRWLWEYARNH
jgi:hypothetical protein